MEELEASTLFNVDDSVGSSALLSKKDKGAFVGVVGEWNAECSLTLTPYLLPLLTTYFTLFIDYHPLLIYLIFITQP